MYNTSNREVYECPQQNTISVSSSVRQEQESEPVMGTDCLKQLSSVQLGRVYAHDGLRILVLVEHV